MGGFAEAIANYNPSAVIARNKILESQAAVAPQAAQQELAAGRANLESKQLENQLRQAQIRDAESIRQLYADDKINGDPVAMQKAAAGKLSGPGFSAFMANQLEIQKMKLANTESANKIAAENRNRAGDIIDGINKQAATDPEIAGATYEAQLPLLQKLAPETPWAPKYDPKYGEFLSDHVGHTAKVLGEKKTQAEISEAAAKSTEANATAGLKTAETPGAKAKSDIEVKQAAAMENATPATIKAQVDSAIDPKKYPGENARTLAMANSALANGLGPQEVQKRITDGADRIGRMEAAVAQAKATAPIKIQVGSAIQAAGANAAEKNGGLDLMAEQALNGTFTSRNPMLMAKVYGRATEIAKERGMDAQGILMARNAAQANKQALNHVTTQYETLKPFAEMAEKNADILEAKSKAVTSLGAPVLNTPIRELEQKFAGNTDVAAFKAALLPVQADFARILSSPTGTGMLTDESKREMQGAIGPGATPGQIKSALDVFRTDAKNRKASYEASIADLTGRSVSGGHGTEKPPATNEPPKATKRYNPATGKIEPI